MILNKIYIFIDHEKRYMMQRMTRQKKLLFETAQTFSSFFDAYELHAKTMKLDKRIGLATIYRFLTTMENDGEIHSFMCGNKKIYSNNKKSHAHFRCEKCGKVKHIDIKNVDFLNESRDEVCHFQIELSGLCAACKVDSTKRL